MQCPKGATQQTRPRSTTPVLAAGPKQHVPGGFSSSTPPQGGTPSGNLREEAPQGRHGRPAPTDVANPPADEFNGIPSHCDEYGMIMGWFRDDLGMIMGWF